MYFPEWVLMFLIVAGITVVGLSIPFLLITLLKEIKSDEGAF